MGREVHKEKYYNKARQFSLFYGDALSEKNVKQDSEGFAVGTSQTWVSRAINPDGDANLLASQVTSSYVAHEIVREMAREIGLDVVAIKGKLNHSFAEELSDILKYASQITRTKDDTIIEAKFRAIAIKALKAADELEVKK